MVSLREYVELIDKLTELTQRNEIEWHRQQPPYGLVTTENRISTVYTTSYSNRFLRLYEEMYKYYTDEDVYHWLTRLVFEFIDGFGNSIWQFPETKNGWDLLNAVKYKDAKVEDFIKDVFGK